MRLGAKHAQKERGKEEHREEAAFFLSGRRIGRSVERQLVLLVALVFDFR
jgi:hypothetical protein